MIAIDHEAKVFQRINGGIVVSSLPLWEPVTDTLFAYNPDDRDQFNGRAYQSIIFNITSSLIDPE